VNGRAKFSASARDLPLRGEEIERAVSTSAKIRYHNASLNAFCFQVLPMRRCPICRQPAGWDDNPHRPFCSERCQTIDLGRWAAEEYRVPLAETPDGLTTDFDREYSFNEQEA
jgi:hypothetical protein